MWLCSNENPLYKTMEQAGLGPTPSFANSFSKQMLSRTSPFLFSLCHHPLLSPATRTSGRMSLFLVKDVWRLHLHLHGEYSLVFVDRGGGGLAHMICRVCASENAWSLNKAMQKICEGRGSHRTTH